MTGIWCWSASSMGALRLGSALAVAAVVAAALPGPAAGATVLNRRIELAFEEGGAITERVGLRVRLDEVGDLADWSPFVIPLDENRTLVASSGLAVKPDGSRVILRDDAVTTVEGVGGGGILHTSARFHLLEFPPLPAGSELHLAWEVREEPWLESTSVPLLLGGNPVERLSVEVSGAGEGLRWRIDPRPAGAPEAGDGGGAEPGEERAREPLAFAVEERAGGLSLTALDVDPGPRSEPPVLRLAWGDRRTWEDVGGWYEGLVEGLPRRPEAVAALARELVAGVDEPRARLAALLDYVRRRVRYVAVEVGVGGYRPSAPGEVLERRWGDCKDKSFLLLDLLAEAGIRAHPALVILAEDRRLDAGFPGADQFNHLIVAVPAGEVAAEPGDVAADGYLFLDATQEMGGLAWLHPAVQGQAALVVRGEGSELATVPVLPEGERRDLSVRLEVGEDGAARGEAVLRLSGHGAWALASATGSATPERLGELAVRVLRGLLPGAALGTPRWRQGDDGGVPLVELSAAVAFDRLVEGRGARFLALPGTDAFPPPGDLEGVTAPRGVRPVRWSAVWELDLPDAWCLPEESDDLVANDAGRYRQVVTPAPGSLVVERTAELGHRWLPPELAAETRELALAELRSARRRLRFSCGG